MALLGWIFIRHVFAPWLPADQLDSYIAGLILLAAAPCTAMVFVWSRLTGGRPAVHAVAGGAERHHHGVRLRAASSALLLGLSSITVPWDTLLTSVVLYIVIPVVLAQLWRKVLLRARAGGVRCGSWHAIGPWSIAALLATLVLLFAFQGKADPRAAAGHRDAGGADPDPGVLQLGPGLLAEPRAWARRTAWPARRR